MITCGVCKQSHVDPVEVKACYERKYNGFKTEERMRIDPSSDAGATRSFSEAFPSDLAELQASVERHPSNVVVIPNGYFTVTFGVDDRITLRVHTQGKEKAFAPEKQIVSYLFGADNTSDYQGFAFADPRTGRVNFWKRYKGNDRLDLAVRCLQGDPEAAGLAFAEESNHCWKCNRLLTVPTSIHRGLGPICAKGGLG